MVARVIGVAPGDGGVAVAGEDADASFIMVLFCAWCGFLD